MLAYAPRRDRRRFSPAGLALIAAAHAVAIVAVINSRLIVDRKVEPPIVVETIPIDPPPEPNPPDSRTTQQPRSSRLDQPISLIPPLPNEGPIVDPTPFPVPNPDPLIGNNVEPLPLPQPDTVRTGPRFITPDSAIRPPYPEAKRRLEQEATLRLRLSIDERGRVVAVDPVGGADPAFLEAARRHILKAWRYQPAREGDKAIASSTVITLKFELD